MGVRKSSGPGSIAGAVGAFRSDTPSAALPPCGRLALRGGGAEHSLLSFTECGVQVWAKSMPSSFLIAEIYQ